MKPHNQDNQAEFDPMSTQAPLINPERQMNAVLIMPSFLGTRFGSHWNKNPTISPPMGLLYVAGAFERAGFNTRVLDWNVERVDRAEFTGLIRQADVVGISVYTHTQPAARDLISHIRDIHPGVKVICGGPHINATLEPFPGADLTFMGEGELTAGEVSRHLVHGDLDRLKQFSGLAYYQGPRLVKTGPKAEVEDLDQVAWPARHLVDPARYGELVGIRLSNRIASVVTSRGCPYSCSFCVREGIPKYRSRSPDNVVDEIEQLAADGHDLLVFSEDNFNVQPQRSLAILKEIKRRGIKTRIMAQARTDSVSEQLMEALRDAGGWSLILGIESGTQEVLDYYQKKTTVKQGRLAVQLADRFGIFTFGFFVLGAPPERHRHFRHNLDYMTSMPLDFVGFNILDYQLGSKLWKEKVAQGVIDPDQTIVRTGSRFGALPYSELLEILRWSYRKFYLRPGYAWRLLAKCWRVGDFTLFFFLLRFCLKLLKRFSDLALADRLVEHIASGDQA